jgi:hypothetical protein
MILSKNHADSGLRMLPQLTKRDAAKTILKLLPALRLRSCGHVANYSHIAE